MNRKRLLTVLILLWFLATVVSVFYAILYISIYAMAEAFIVSFVVRIILALFAPRIRRWAERQPTKVNTHTNPPQI